jgi:hypothetical protein
LRRPVTGNVKQKVHAIEALIGVLFVLGGVHVMSQARRPREKRTVRLGRSGSGPILNTGQCIRIGGIFAIAGASAALEGTGIQFGTPHVLVAVALAAMVIVASAIAGDDAYRLSRR